MNEIFISTDVETDGPIPGPHSMLSLGSAAYTPQKQLLSTFSANFETLPGSVGTSEDGRVVGKPARCLGSLPRKPGIAPGRDGAIPHMGQISQWQTSLRRLSRGFRFPVCILVSHALRRREPFRSFCIGHQILRDGRLESWLPREHQEKHTETLVRQ